MILKLLLFYLTFSAVCGVVEVVRNREEIGSFVTEVLSKVYETEQLVPAYVRVVGWMGAATVSILHDICFFIPVKILELINKLKGKA